MKKKVLLVITLFVVIIIVVVLFTHKSKEINFKESYTINVGDKIPTIKKYLSKDVQLKESIDIAWKDINLEDNRIYYTGIYLGKFKYKKNDYKVKLVVIDKIAPKVEEVKNIEIFVNDKVDFYQNLKITDNSKDEISKEVEGEYDLSKKGEYNLKYVIKDKSGNVTKKDFKLIVKEKPVDKEPEKKASTGTTKKGYKIEQKNGIYYINGVLIANKTYSLPSTYNPGGLMGEFNNNFANMNNDAKNQGINLKIISGFRSYQTQQTLYNNYVARDGKTAADRYSARAGHSEHQTGLAADINSLEQSWENTKEGKWLNDNCYKYGFIIRYPKGKEAITGYMFEPWHIRYVGVDIAKALYNNGNWITLEEYLGIDSKY